MKSIHLTEREGTGIIFNVANITYIKSSNAGVKIGTVDGKEVAVKESHADIIRMLEEIK